MSPVSLVAPQSASLRVQQTHVAEWVSPGHPDRLADAIAERIVRHACRRDLRALVGVEVALHRRRVFVDGRIAAHDLGEADTWLPGLVRAAYAAAGHGAVWAPAPADLVIDHDLCIDDLRDDERLARCVSDDQNVVLGWAGYDARSDYLPPAHFLAGTLGKALWLWRAGASDDFGPDFKLLPQLDELDDGTFRWRRLTLSIQHRVGLTYEDQHRRLLPVLRAALAPHERAGLAGIASGLDASVLHVNGAGAFELGGPLGDNGLSGKKLVVDHYGPGVPIGGGALYGKDPHKIDRSGPLRARAWALDVLRDSQPDGAREVRTRLVWSPGDAAPSLCEAWWCDAVGVWRAVPESRVPPREWFTIERIVADLIDGGLDAFAAPGALGVVPGAD